MGDTIIYSLARVIVEVTTYAWPLCELHIYEVWMADQQ